MTKAQDVQPAGRDAMRLHGFAVISGIGWLLDFSVFNALALTGLALFAANLIGAACGVTFVFVTARRFIFKNAVVPLNQAVLLYVGWNVIGILLASAAVAGIAALIAVWELPTLGNRILAAVGLDLDTRALVPAVSKLAVTPVTMYLNFVVMGLITERRLRWF